MPSRAVKMAPATVRITGEDNGAAEGGEDRPANREDTGAVEGGENVPTERKIN